MCELCGADVSVVAKGMGLDNRIGPKFLNPGPGFGGICFPKDTRALIGMGSKLGYIPKIVKSTVSVNENQSIRMFRKIRKNLSTLKDKTISILGVAFKPDTDDIREAPAIIIIKKLLEKNAMVKVYDPKAMNNLKEYYPELNVEYNSDPYDSCLNSDCIVLITEWDEFKNLDFSKLKSIVRKPIFLDLRNVYDSDYVKSFGFSYEGVGRK
jgi:UDPglucose 6-dehydrogenase